MSDKSKSTNNFLRRKVFILGTLFLLVALLCFYLFQSQHKKNMYEAGFCKKTEEYITSQKAYEAAIQFVLDYRSQSENLSVNAKYWPDPRLPKYVDVADFIKQNPNCCLVDLLEKTDSNNSVYYGDKGYAIGVHLRESLDEHTSYFSTSVDLKTCGEIIGASYSAEGFSLKALKLYEPVLVEKYKYMPSTTFINN